jgi:hypothetical protein
VYKLDHFAGSRIAFLASLGQQLPCFYGLLDLAIARCSCDSLDPVQAHRLAFSTRRLDVLRTRTVALALARALGARRALAACGPLGQTRQKL